MPIDPPLPPGFVLRAAAREDAPNVAALGIAQDLDDLGEADYSEDEVLSEWSAPGFDPERDAWIVTDEAGTPVAYAAVDGRAVRVFMDPRFKGRGIGAHLATLTEAHARERGAGQAMQQVFGRNDAARALLAARGYENDQHYWHMRIDLEPGAPLADTEWPAVLANRRFDRGRDERDAHRLTEAAFAMVPGNVSQTLEEWQASWGRPGRVDPALTTVIEDGGGRMVGIATCAVQDDGGGYLAQLAVDEAERGQGLGRGLLVETFRLAQAAGVPRVSLDVNAANAGAAALYESAGMRQEWHSDRWVKRLG